MTDIKINFSNTKIAKFYDDMNMHLTEIEKVLTPSTKDDTDAETPSADPSTTKENND